MSPSPPTPVSAAVALLRRHEGAGCRRYRRAASASAGQAPPRPLTPLTRQRRPTPADRQRRPADASADPQRRPIDAAPDTAADAPPGPLQCLLLRRLLTPRCWHRRQWASATPRCTTAASATAAGSPACSATAGTGEGHLAPRRRCMGLAATLPTELSVHPTHARATRSKYLGQCYKQCATPGTFLFPVRQVGRAAQQQAWHNACYSRLAYLPPQLPGSSDSED